MLIISYFFPPMGGVGVQRIVKFAKYLPAFDVRPIVVTAPEPQLTGHWYDPTFSDDLIKAPVAVYRVDRDRTVSVQRPRSVDRIRRVVGLQRRFSRWWVQAGIATALRLCSHTNIDCLLATMSPFESAQIAHGVRRATGIPWIADLRDPWALDEMMTYPTHLHRLAERYRMRYFLATASRIVMNTPEAARAMADALGNGARPRVCSITNGYDPDDFRKAAPLPKDAPFMIVYTGRFHTELGSRIDRHPLYYRGLGKVINGVNILARSHYYLLEALRMLGLESPSIMPELRLVVAGSLTDCDRRLIAERGMTNRVICKGKLDHLRTIGLLKAADLLFLPLHTVPAGKRATIVPGKTYEYLASGKPILAALPPGDAREMCMRAGNALMCDPDDAVGLARNIERAYRAWKNGSRMLSAQNNGHTRYERKRLAAQLATVVHGVASGRTTSPPISEQWNR